MNDAELITKLGGPTKLAARLNFSEKGGVQRVQNWMTRGIPASVKVAFPDIFLGRSTTDPGEPVNPATASQEQ